MDVSGTAYRNEQNVHSWEVSDSSGVVGDHLLRRVYITAAEEVHVYQERVELVERHPLGRPGGKWEYLVVCVRELLAQSSEQFQHSQIDFTMTAIGGGVEDARAPVDIHVQVSAPEVPVQPGGRLFRADKVGEST